MKRTNSNISLKAYEDIFTTQEERQETGEHVIMIPVDQIHEFKDHPFKVVDDEDMRKTVDSIREYGVLVPAIVRPDGENQYEMISGHRRRYASILAGKEEMPCIVREMDDDTATILMVDSNLQREHILPSEKAKAYKMKLDAMKRKAGRPPKENVSQVGTQKRSDEVMAEEIGTSRNQIQRFIRLNNFIPELLQMVDDRKISFSPAVELSYLNEKEQKAFYETVDALETPPSLSQAQRLKKHSQEGTCTSELIEEIMEEDKKSPMNRVVFDSKLLAKYFPAHTTSREMEQQILKLLEQWAGK